MCYVLLFLAHDSLDLESHVFEQKRFGRRYVQCLSLGQQSSNQVVEHALLGEKKSHTQESSLCIWIVLPRPSEQVNQCIEGFVLLGGQFWSRIHVPHLLTIHFLCADPFGNGGGLPRPREATQSRLRQHLQPSVQDRGLGTKSRL